MGFFFGGGMAYNGHAGIQDHFLRSALKVFYHELILLTFLHNLLSAVLVEMLLYPD